MPTSPAASAATAASLALWLAAVAMSGCAERPATAAADPPRVNVLFAISDDQSYPHAGAYGAEWVRTPAFDRVAREGLLFERAYTPNAKCAPSRACILTGRNSWELGAAANHSPYFPPRFRSVIEALGQAGYRTGCTGKGWAPGVAEAADGSPRELTGPGYRQRRSPGPTPAISTIDYAANFDDFLAARERDDPDAPFFFWYGGNEPHRPYAFGSALEQSARTPSDAPPVPGMWPADDTVRTDLLDYAYEIEHFDRHLAAMLDALEERGELDRTLVVVTADNGMPFPRIKGQAYERSNHLPLAVRWPGGIADPGRRVPDYVSFVDFAPTFLALAGLTAESAGMAAITGRSLLPLLDGTATSPHREHVLIGKERHDVGRPRDAGYPIRGIVREDYLYLENREPSRWPLGNPETGYLNADGSPTKTLLLERRREGRDTAGLWAVNFGRRPPVELYDLDADPDCLVNLSADPAHRERQRAMRETLARELRAQEDPRALGRGDTFDAFPYAGEWANFYERYAAGEEVTAPWVEEGDAEPAPLE